MPASMLFKGMGYFTDNFLIEIQLKVRFAFIRIPIKWSPHNFVYGTTVALLWYVQTL